MSPDTSTHRLHEQVKSVYQLLSEPQLHIPNYQRPYKWTADNLQALLTDLRNYRDKSAYRLGTVVFHHNSEHLDIVDGQQRTLTLMLLVKAIAEHMQEHKDLIQRKDLSEQIAELVTNIDAFLSTQPDSPHSGITHTNLYQNYQAAKRAVAQPEFGEADIAFLLHKCQVVTFVLNDISEAFQFFDSQNSRGRDLNPHDLLKAYHLREFPEHEAALKAEAVKDWESQKSHELARVFAHYLYRIRHWVNNQQAHYFSKDDIGLFKGVNLYQAAHYPYTQALRIQHEQVDNYNNHFQRKLDQNTLAFPFQLDQIVINGRRFFEMIAHYQTLINSLTGEALTKQSSIPLSDRAQQILNALNSYGARHRTGDRYIRMLFDCALLYYFDKFGKEQLSEAIEKFFIWAYSCRLTSHAVYIETMDNHARNSKLFKLIQSAISPKQVLALPLKTLTPADLKASKMGDLVKLFEGMKYYVESK